MRLILFNLIRRFTAMGERRFVNSSAERNKNPIKETLGQYLYTHQDTGGDQQQVLLEISSGTGQHIVYLAKYFPWISYQPTEIDKSLFGCIASYIQFENLPNVNPPIYLDVRDPPEKWLDGQLHENSIDYVLNINMMHISEWDCTEGLFNGCGKILKPGKFLFTYGPYAVNGNIEPESNVRFNEHLKAQNPGWGLRDIIRQLEPLAAKNGIHLLHSHSLPANNRLLVWQKKNQELDESASNIHSSE